MVGEGIGVGRYELDLINERVSVGVDEVVYFVRRKIFEWSGKFKMNMVIWEDSV